MKRPMIGLLAALILMAAPPISARAENVYSRVLSDPFDQYSFVSNEAQVAAIRTQGHPIPTGHPRIFINAANRDALRQKILAHYVQTNLDYMRWMQEAVNLADKNYGTTLVGPKPGEWALRKEHPAQPVVLAEAIIYQLGVLPGVTYQHTPEEYGRDGVRHLLSLLESTYDEVVYLALPLGYDWLYDLMTDSQRQTVAQKLLELAQPTNAEAGAMYQSYGNHPMGAQLLGALAVYGDDAFVSRDQVSKTLDLFYDGMVFGDLKFSPTFKVTMSMIDIFTPEGPGEQGLGYSSKYSIFYPVLLAWRDQTGKDYFQLPFFQQWPLYFVHATGNLYEHQAGAARLVRRAWEQGAEDGYQRAQMMLEMGLAPSRPAAASLMKYHYQKGGVLNVEFSSRLIYMLASDPTLQPQSASDLKLADAAHFEGVNHVFARNSWVGRDSTWLWFMGPTWNSRNVGPSNDLMIWKNGGFLLTKRQQGHDYRGGNRTNTLVLYDPSKPGQTFIPRNVMDDSQSYDRGIRLKDPGVSLTGLNKNLFGYHKGLRYFQEIPGEVLYVEGDGEGIFSGTKGSSSDPNLFQFTSDFLTLPGWSRQVAWFRTSDNNKTDHFILFDRIEKPSDAIQEHLMFNFNMLPQIRDRQTNASSGEGQMQIQGIWRYDQANRIVATNTVTTDWGTAHARLFMDTLWPRQPIYYRMGGIAPADRPLENARNIDLFGTLQQDRLEVWGSPDDPQNILNGMWRVQVTSPPSGIRQANYLHVLQATDSLIDTPDPAILLEGQGMIGALVANNIALFNPSEAILIAGNVTLPAATQGTYRILLADLEPSAAYEIAIGGVKQTQAASIVGIIFLRDVLLKGGDVLTLLKTSGTPLLCGDVNGDGIVDIRDVIALIRISIGADPTPKPGTDPFRRADVNGDGTLDIVDVVLLIKHLLGEAELACRGG